MAWYEVRGGRPLDGAVKIQGSKNGALPVLAGALLHRGRTVLHNCPGITDVGYTLEILRSLGCSVTVEKDALILDAAGLDRNRVPESLGEKMRSSVILSRMLHHRKTSHRPSFKNALRDGSDLYGGGAGA